MMIVVYLFCRYPSDNCSAGHFEQELQADPTDLAPTVFGFGTLITHCSYLLLQVSTSCFVCGGVGTIPASHLSSLVFISHSDLKYKNGKLLAIGQWFSVVCMVFLHPFNYGS